ncbi:MAG: transcription elongation factor GreA [Ignavibacteria bacterium]|nr:transcription elongation factor GreA [Ignavibacteria bacterium]
MQNSGAVYLNRERLSEIESELNDLRFNKRKMIAEKIAEARAHGDISENAEYDAAREEQSLLEIKIAKLENLLSRVKIIDPSDMPEGQVYILSSVKVKDLTHNEEINMTMVSPEEADIEFDKIAVTSPVGQALLGKKVGDIVEVSVGNSKIEYQILEINK